MNGPRDTMKGMDVYDPDEMLADLARLVDTESPSGDLERLAVHAELLASILETRLGSRPRLIASPVGPHVHWSGGGEPKVLILGHHDTVHPAGTVTSRPFAVRDGVATGPGVFDMKAGIVQAVHAVASLDDASHVEILLTADEETGSKASKELLEERARACGAVLVLEPSADGGALKIGRKGTGTFHVAVHGRASHAGLEPEKGVNALTELAALIPVISGFARPEAGTTVTPTLATAGTADNVVPAFASCAVDVRVTDATEKSRVEAAFAALSPGHPDARIEITGGIGRPPMHESAAAGLMPVARRVAGSLGIAIDGVVVGGGSDGNFTAAIGIETLDGLGAVGGGAHAETEHVTVSTLAVRAALIAGICQELSSMARRPPLGSVPADR